MFSSIRGNKPLWLHAIAVVSILMYIIVYVNLPTFLFASADHDDGLFITHAYSFASGHWLGKFGDLTLAKGPGYSIFLGLLALFRIPVSLGHCVFYASSVWVLAYVTQKTFRSLLLSVAVFEILLWHFGPHSMRVIRDSIVTPEVLFTLSFLILALFVSRKSATMHSALAGASFGCLWITREDAVVLVPALALIWICAFQKAYKVELNSLRELAGKLVFFAASAFGIVASVATVNFIEYRTFSVVDMGRNFRSALEALESVKPDTFVPYEGVSRSAREKVYGISPTFARLKPFLESSDYPFSMWKQSSCGWYPKVCGDYAIGWFMWAFRDAAAADGEYASESRASNFYLHIADDIHKGCKSGAISCYHNFLPYVSHVDRSQWKRAWTSARIGILQLAFMLPPPLADINSMGSEDQLEAASAFLNLTYHTPPPADPSALFSHPIQDFAVNVRASAVRVYGIFLPVLLITGLSCFVIVLVWSAFRRMYPIGLAIAGAAWLAVACRLGVLVLVEVSSFPAVVPLYMNYAYVLACFGAFVSVYACAQVVANQFFMKKTVYNPEVEFATAS